MRLAARLIAGVKFLGQTSSRWYESRVFPWGLFRRGPILRSAILGQQAALENNLFGTPNADQTKLMEDLLRQYYVQLRDTRRQVRTDKPAAARSVLFAPLSRYGIHTDAGRMFPDVLSFEQWQAIQKAEDEREASRVALREKKEQDRAAYSVARGGVPCRASIRPWSRPWGRSWQPARRRRLSCGNGRNKRPGSRCCRRWPRFRTSRRKKITFLPCRKKPNR